MRASLSGSSGIELDGASPAGQMVSGSPAFVSVMQTAHLRDGDDRADVSRLHRSGSVSRQRDVPTWKHQKLYQDPIAAFAPRISLRTSLRDVVSRHGLRWAEVEDWMERLRLGASLLDRFPDQVSSGELQRIALIRVLLLRPVLLVADEPTSRLDPITQQETIDLLAECLADLGCALVLVTHDPAIAGNIASRVLTLDALPAPTQ